MREQSGLPLDVDQRFHHQARPGAAHTDGGFQQDKEQQPDTNQGQQPLIPGGDRVVHYQLGTDRHNQPDGLNHHGKREDFQQSLFQPVNITDKLAQAEFFHHFLFGEGAAGPGFQGHAGEITRHLLDADHPAAVRRVVQNKFVAADFDQYQEVIEIPV